MLHLGPRAFEEIGGEVVQSVAFVLRNTTIVNVSGTYLRLVDERTAREKKRKGNRSCANSNWLIAIHLTRLISEKSQGCLIAYWLNKSVCQKL